MGSYLLQVSMSAFFQDFGYYITSFYHFNKCTTQTQGANNRGKDKEGIWELSLPYAQFSIKPKTALKKN